MHAYPNYGIKMDGSRDTETSTEPTGRPWIRHLVPDFVRRRYTLKFALVLAIMGITIGLIGATATSAVAHQIEQNIEEEYQDLVEQQANAIETWIERNSISVKIASKNEVLSNTGPGSRFEIRQELATTAGNVYGVHAIYLINPNGSKLPVVASPQFTYERDLSKTSRAWLQSVPFDSMKVMNVYVTDTHRVGETAVVAFVSPVDGHVGRYLVMEYTVQDLAVSLSTENVGRFTQVVNDAGIIQVASRDEEILEPYGNGTAMRPIRLADRIARSPREAGVISEMPPNEAVLDERYTVGYAPIEVSNVKVNWTVLLHEPHSNVFGFVRAISRWGKLATIGGVILVGILGTLIGYNTTRDINRLRDWARQMQEGDLSSTKTTSRIDAIGELYDGFENMRSSLQREIEEVERARKEAEASRAEAVAMSEYLQEKAEEYSTIMHRCAEGDLTQRLEPDGENESMDQIAMSFNEMMAELERTTSELKQFAVKVEDTGEILQASSDRIRVASGHVADSVQRIADDADEQKERLQEISEQIDELADTFQARTDDDADEKVQASIERLNDTARQINEIATLSEKTLAESGIVAGAAEEQASELTEVSERAQDLTRYAQPLHDALDEFDTDVETDLHLDFESSTDRVD